MNPLVRLRNVRLSYASREVLRLEQLDLVPGQLVTLVGPNGAGKSTLLRVLSGIERHYAGECLLEGRSIAAWPRTQLARCVSFLPQQVELAFPFTVEQVVLMGRTPHCGGFFDSPEDLAAARQAMSRADVGEFRDRDIRTLSGGERQRVLLASALAQSARVLLLDEPTTFLDLKHQYAICRLLRQLAEEGALVVAVTHDLALAAAFSHRMLVLNRGALAADGEPTVALDPAVVRGVFEVDRVPGFPYGESGPR
jgi:iron complex transport system ATP-binding protein